MKMKQKIVAQKLVFSGIFPSKSNLTARYQIRLV